MTAAAPTFGGLLAARNDETAPLGWLAEIETDAEPAVLEATVRARVDPELYSGSLSQTHQR